MIQHYPQALIVCHGDGRLESLDVHDLIQFLKTGSHIPAAALDPWVLEKLVECVIRHFRKDLRRERVPLSEFKEWMHLLVGEYLGKSVPERQETPANRLDLLEVACRCGTAFELEFFPEIRRFLSKRTGDLRRETSLKTPSADGKISHSRIAVEKEKTTLRITGLRRSAKFLSGRSRWGKRCSEMRDEIVAYIRQEAARSGVRDSALVVLS